MSSFEQNSINFNFDAFNNVCRINENYRTFKLTEKCDPQLKGKIINKTKSINDPDVKINRQGF